MSTIIGTSVSQVQAASAISDLRNRGYQVEAELLNADDAADHTGQPEINRLAGHNGCIMVLHCKPSQAEPIKEHLGELHGINDLQIMPEKD